MQLYIGNKNYSSWSMRPWVVLSQFGIAFEETMVRFDDFSSQTDFKKRITRLSPAGKVPVLVDDRIVIWDSLAIVEYLAEKFPEINFWPTESASRAHARSICAEMHSGFAALRSACPMNIEAYLPEIGALVLRDNLAVREDLSRITNMWSTLLDKHGGPMLFGDFSIADAYFSPIVMRLKTYGLPVPEVISNYMDRVSKLTGVRAWVEEAVLEENFIETKEPYRLTR